MSSTCSSYSPSGCFQTFDQFLNLPNFYVPIRIGVLHRGPKAVRRSTSSKKQSACRSFGTRLSLTPVRDKDAGSRDRGRVTDRVTGSRGDEDDGRVSGSCSGCHSDREWTARGDVGTPTPTNTTCALCGTASDVVTVVLSLASSFFSSSPHHCDVNDDSGLVVRPDPRTAHRSTRLSRLTDQLTRLSHHVRTS